MKKNDVINLDIIDVTIEGTGIGRFENIAVFVPNAALGDKLKVRVIKINKNYVIGKIEDIIKPSTDRIESDCACYKKCGGCAFRHISYESELNIKYNHVHNCLTRIGGFKNINISPIIGSKEINGYRNKSQVPVRKDASNNIVTGFFSNHSHRIIDCNECLLHPKEFNIIVNAIKEWIIKYKISPYDEEKNTGLIRHIYLRKAESTDEIMICLVVNGNDIPFKEELLNIISMLNINIVSVVINSNLKKTNVILGDKCKVLFGKEYITDKLFDLKFDISPLSFYQVNRKQTEVLYSLVKEHLKNIKNSNIIDLYCGIGTIGLCLASNVSKVTGIEIVEQAVKDAYRNASKNNIKNAEFICSDASELEKNIKDISDNLGAVILDPPRKGCSSELIQDVIKLKPNNIIYVSCNPATLARDLKLICENNYSIEEVTPVDMFPRTSHVETVVLLSRKDII